VNYLLNCIKKLPFRGRAFLIRILSFFNKSLKKYPFFFNNYEFPFYLNLNDDTAINLFLNNGLSHEKGLLSILNKISNKNNVFWDIGSNYGFYPHHILNNNLFLESICFEPNPNNYDLLSLTLKNQNNFKTYNFGIGEKKSFLNFYYSKNRSDLGSFSPVANYKNTRIKKIEINSIDNVLKFISKPDIIKIDVEGFENEVFKGFTSLNKIYPVIIIEWIDNLQPITLEEFLNYFDNSWNHFFIDNDGYLHKIKPKICSSDLLLVSSNNNLYDKIISDLIVK